MPKGYLIAHLTVTDAQAYAAYAKDAGEILRKAGAKTLARSGPEANYEGEAHERHLVFEFASVADAKRFYDSAEYQAAKALREPASTATFVIVEGVE
jgi:uncharacterized protein (DUF1330 family)